MLATDTVPSQQGLEVRIHDHWKLRPGRNAQSMQDGRDVLLDRLGRQRQLACDELVGLALHEQRQNIDQSWRQRQRGELRGQFDLRSDIDQLSQSFAKD